MCKDLRLEHGVGLLLGMKLVGTEGLEVQSEFSVLAVAAGDLDVFAGAKSEGAGGTREVVHPFEAEPGVRLIRGVAVIPLIRAMRCPHRSMHFMS